MANVRHSVALTLEKCRGCTHCLQRCPTEAIRIRDGHAQITTTLCIDCGECIRTCGYQAKHAEADPFECIQDYNYKIALPAPALYGQFDHLDDINYVLDGLLKIGFDDIFEVAQAAELVSGYSRRYIMREDVPKPVISSACPVIGRLISIRYPDLVDNVLPLHPPVDMAAKLARIVAKKEHPELTDEDIGIFFISPCPAKVSYLKQEAEEDRQLVDGVLSMTDIYKRLVQVMKRGDVPPPRSKTGRVGIRWAGSGGEAKALSKHRHLAASGIENVIKVLDSIDNDTLPGRGEPLRRPVPSPLCGTDHAGVEELGLLEKAGQHLHSGRLFPGRDAAVRPAGSTGLRPPPGPPETDGARADRRGTSLAGLWRLRSPDLSGSGRGHRPRHRDHGRLPAPWKGPGKSSEGG